MIFSPFGQQKKHKVNFPIFNNPWGSWVKLKINWAKINPKSTQEPRPTNKKKRERYILFSYLVLLYLFISFSPKTLIWTHTLIPHNWLTIHSPYFENSLKSLTKNSRISLLLKSNRRPYFSVFFFFFSLFNQKVNTFKK